MGEVILGRRGFLTGLASALVAGPAVIRTPGLLMPVSVQPEPVIYYAKAGSLGTPLVARNEVKIAVHARLYGGRFRLTHEELTKFARNVFEAYGDRAPEELYVLTKPLRVGA